MKKLIFQILVAMSIFFLLPAQIAEACTGFIVGKNLTTDGSTLYGRTEDLEPNHNKVFLVHERKTNPAGSTLVDQPTGFTWTLPSESYKYTSVSDVTIADGQFDEVGFNEYGVSLSATVSASANNEIKKVDPYVENGLAESILATVVLPHVKTAKEGVELIGKIVEEKGAAEGNILVLADKEGVWYMEILSGHQYVAIKFPDDKFAVFPNTFFLGHVDFTDKENVIASKDVEKVAKDAGTYKEVDGAFHISRSYNPPLKEADRSRAWSGIKALNPDAPVNYDDANFDLMQSTSKKISVADVMRMQRNRFEGTQFKPLDQMQLDGKGLPKKGTVDPIYKYPLGNPNVMEAHIFQLKDNIPASMGGGTMWLSVGSPRFAPYLPYYGNITETFDAYKVDTTYYHPDSWYWVASRIYDWADMYPELFGTSIQEKWKTLEEQLIATQADQDAIYANTTADTSAEVTEATLVKAKEVFAEMKALEAEMEAKIKSNTTTTTQAQSSKDTTTTQPKTSQPTTKQPTTSLPPITSVTSQSTTSLPSTTSTTSQPTTSTTTSSTEPKTGKMLVDSATGIQIFNKDFNPETVDISVSKVTNVAKLQGKNYEAYDINLKDKKNNKMMEKVTPTQVTIPVKKNATVEALYYVTKDGELESLTFSEDKGKSVTFTTDHFSTYAVVYGKETKSSNSPVKKFLPSTGESVSWGLVSAGVIILVAAGFVFFRRKK